MMAAKGKMSTYGDLLKAAMEITKQEDADQMLLTLVDRCAKESGKSHAECVKIQRSNLGYFAGYYDNETRERVERLFECQHPVFGAIATKGVPSAEEAFEMGKKIGKSMKATK